MAKNDVYECTATNGLRIRKGPSTNADIVGTLTKGERVKEIAIEREWLKHSRGYSNMAYLKKVASSTVNTSIG